MLTPWENMESTICLLTERRWGSKEWARGQSSRKEKAAAFALTRSRQPCLRRKLRKLTQKEEPADSYWFVFLWFMKAIYLTIDIGQVFDDAESSCKQFLGSYLHLLSDTHQWLPFFVPHLFFCGTLNSFFGSSNVGSKLYIQSPKVSWYSWLFIVFTLGHPRHSYVTSHSLPA